MTPPIQPARITVATTLATVLATGLALLVGAVLAAQDRQAPRLVAPRGLDSPVPGAATFRPAVAALGRSLFFEAQLSIDLPTTKSGEQAERFIGDVIVNVDAGGEISVNNAPLEIEDLERRLSRLAEISPGQSVIIRSDGGTDWQDVVAVLDACTMADIWNIKFAVLPVLPEEE